MPKPTEPEVSTGNRTDEDVAAADRHFRTEHLKPDLARRSVAGSAVTLAAQGVKVVLQFAAIVVLARLLAPADFGLFAVVAAFLTIFELFKDLGLSVATVQRAHITNREVSTLFWMNVGLGAFIAAVLAATAPLLGWIYSAPELVSLTPAVAATLVLTGIAAQHLAILRRQMRFATLAAVQTGAELVALVAAVAAAFGGLGIWALVVQRVTWSAMTLVGAWVASGWRPGPPGRISEVRGYLAFGGNVTAAMVLGRCAGSVDKILIGWFWGPVQLGLFERSEKLVQMPIQNVNTPLSAVALPMLSRLTDRPDAYRGAYRAITERVAMLVAPGAGLVIAASAPVVELVLGPQWRGAAPILGWMGVTAVYMPVTYTLSWLYMSQDRTPEMLRAAVLNAAINIGLIVAALPHGPVAVAAAISLGGLCLRAPLMFWLAGRRGPVSVADLAGVMALPAVAAGMSAAAVAFLQTAPPVATLSPLASVAVLAAAALLATLLVYTLAPRGRRMMADTLRYPRTLLSPAAPP